MGPEVHQDRFDFVVFHFEAVSFCLETKIHPAWRAATFAPNHKSTKRRVMRNPSCGIQDFNAYLRGFRKYHYAGLSFCDSVHSRETRHKRIYQLAQFHNRRRRLGKISGRCWGKVRSDPSNRDRRSGSKVKTGPCWSGPSPDRYLVCCAVCAPYRGMTSVNLPDNCVRLSMFDYSLRQPREQFSNERQRRRRC